MFLLCIHITWILIKSNMTITPVTYDDSLSISLSQEAHMDMVSEAQISLIIPLKVRSLNMVNTGINIISRIHSIHRIRPLLSNLALKPALLCIL